MVMSPASVRLIPTPKRGEEFLAALLVALVQTFAPQASP
jgi:hypothetical protein